MLTPMLQPSLQPVLSASLKPLFGFKPNAIMRNILFWDAAAGSYGKLNEPVQLEVGDTIEYIGQMQSSTSARFLLDGKDDSAGRVFCYMDSSTKTLNFPNFLTATLDGVSAASAVTVVNDSFIHTLRLTTSASAHIGFIGARFSMVSAIDQAILAVNVYKADGTSKHKFNFLGLLSDQRSVLDSVSGDKLRYALNVNSPSSAIRLPTNYDIGDWFELTYIAESSATLRTFIDTPNRNRVRLMTDDSFNISGFDVTVNGVPVVNTDQAPVSGVVVLRCTATVADSLERIFGFGSTNSSFWQSVVLRYRDSTGRDFDFTDNRNVIKSTNATLGSELVPVGKFNSPTDLDWFDVRSSGVNVVIENGRAKLTQTGVSWATWTKQLPTQAGKVHLISADIEVESGFVYLQVRSTPSNTLLGEVKATNTTNEALCIPVPDGDTHLSIRLHGGATDSVGYFDNISVKEATDYASYSGQWKQVPENPNTNYVELINFASSQVKPYEFNVALNAWVNVDDPNDVIEVAQ